MGSTRDWLPSRRSVESQRGGFWMVFDGHWRSGRLRGWKALYFVDGSLSIGMVAGVSVDRQNLPEEEEEVKELSAWRRQKVGLTHEGRCGTSPPMPLAHYAPCSPAISPAPTPGPLRAKFVVVGAAQLKVYC